MPWIIDYPVVMDQMREQKLKCLYPNSGAFGFPDPAAVRTVGWIGPADSTLKPDAAALARSVPPPYEQNLSQYARKLWLEHLNGRLWVMPMSHWAYELDFGSRDWLPAVLEHIDLDPGLLADRNNGAAIEFMPHEADAFTHLMQRLLEMLLGSDFMLAFPRKNVLCTIHHHKQLWWSGTDAKLMDAIEGFIRDDVLPSPTGKESE